MGIHLIALVAALLVQGPGKLEIKDTTEGKGRAAQAKDVVTLEYTGTLQSGKQFDSSKGKQPISFILGSGKVIKGWDQGVLGMKVGGKRHLVIPPDLGYGDEAMGDVIPAKSMLVFDVELLRIDRAGDDEKLDLKTTAEGKGDAAKTGDELMLNWRWSFLNGAEFMSTYSAKRPFKYVVGTPRVPKGFAESFDGMKEGEKRHCVVPYPLAYGESGAPPLKIAPYATIVVDVEAVSVTPKDKIAERDRIANEKDKKLLKIEDETVGTGAEAKDGDTVDVHYTGTFPDGKKFDSSKDRGQPMTVKVGAGQVIRGFDLGILGMKVGGKRKVTIPPELGYGAAGAGGGVIPPNATLVFEIELVSVK